MFVKKSSSNFISQEDSKEMNMPIVKSKKGLCLPGTGLCQLCIGASCLGSLFGCYQCLEDCICCTQSDDCCDDC